MTCFRSLLVASLLCLVPALAFAADNVNVNTASKQELLDGLKGITEKQADAIIEYRNKQGPIVVLNELDTIDGIGRELIEPNYNRLTVGDVNWGNKKS
ncbi:MAG TPA: helix-hairpin-helix domain-containing protein [Gammaproteobacteria bacterium]|nr:helix-hairpin-helix domain-containing protein [Gammaproteobacteria bacterium]